MAPLPTRIFAGIEVPDTALVKKALAYTRGHLNDVAYNHVVRSWLFGFAIASKTPLKDRDLEVHSVSAILHDLGWDTTGELVSRDKRFEVDGANAARDFLKREAIGSEWDSRRLQLVWDAIALHTTPSIAFYKEPEVVATTNGILADFTGPGGPLGELLTWDEYNKIVEELPRLQFKEGMKDIMCGLCRTKPETTVRISRPLVVRYVSGLDVNPLELNDYPSTTITDLRTIDSTTTSLGSTARGTSKAIHWLATRSLICSRIRRCHK